MDSRHNACGYPVGMTCSTLFFFFMATALLFSEEEQSHGVQFEREVVNHMLYRDYTAEWDIPAEANRYNPGVPISVKMIRWGNSIYLGDALRQRQIDQPFEILVSFYEKSEKGESAKILALHLIQVKPEIWRKVWGDLTAEELVEFNRKIEEGTVGEAQAYAKKEAKRLRAKSGIMNIHPKINKDQRRIQCAIAFDDFYRFFLGESEPQPQKSIELWGRPFKKEFPLGSRSR